MPRNTPRKRTPGSNKLQVPALGPIEHLPPELLKPYKRNARTHSERQIALIVQSFEEFGFNNPIIADEDGTIIAGHGRWEAAKLCGMDTVPVVRVKHMTPTTIRAYRLADNRLAELAGWDEEMLALEIGELEPLIDFSIEVLGWEHAEIDVMLEKEPERDAVDSNIPDRPAVPVSRPGDLWLLDKHRLYNGSSLDTESFGILMDGAKAHMVFQDAPYNARIKGHVSGLGKVQHREFAMASGEMSTSEFQQFNATNLKALIPFLHEGAILCMCMDWRGLLALQLAMAEAGLEQINLAVWVKTNGGMGSLYRSQHELVIIAKNGKAKHINNVQLGKFKRYRTNVWRYAGVNTFGRGRMDQLEAHPTPKPVPLVADAIRDVSNRGQIVLDTFMGSGATLLAAERTERIAYGIDIDPGYIDVSILRWEKMTGRKARLAATGQTMLEVMEGRSTQTSLDNETLLSPK